MLHPVFVIIFVQHTNFIMVSESGKNFLETGKILQ